jgi:hypothetical protein
MTGDREWDRFAEGYRLGYWTGREVGYRAAEEDMATDWERWRSTVRELVESDEVGASRRVRAAERYSRALADRHAHRFNRQQAQVPLRRGGRWQR